MWQHLNSKKQQEQIDWRRTKVLEMMSKGETNQSEIARVLKVDKSVISKDVAILKEQSRENLEKHIQERLPLEYQNCMTEIDRVIRMACDITEKPIDDKTRLQALSLLNECYKYKMDLTTNGVVITDAIKFVQTNKEKLTTSDKKENDKDSAEPEYNEDKDQLEERQGVETEELGEEKTTTNQVF
jgi:hypothetical protein